MLASLIMAAQQVINTHIFDIKAMFLVKAISMLAEELKGYAEALLFGLHTVLHTADDG